MKSRFGIDFFSSSVTVLNASLFCDTLTACSSLATSLIAAPPESIVTDTLMSWPARSLGLTGIGVMRDASGTWFVSPAKPVPWSLPSGA